MYISKSVFSVPTYLLLCHGVVLQDQVRQAGEAGQHVEVGQLGNVVGREDQVGQVGHCRWEAGLDAGDAVAREEQRRDARREGEVAQDLDVVIGEVYRIVGLELVSCLTWPTEHRTRGGTHAGDAQILNGGDSVACIQPTGDWYQLCSSLT